MHNIKDFDFDSKASRYDSSMGKGVRRFYSLLVSQVELFQGAAVLDVGCGTGALLRKMADTCGITGCGIDISENMVAEAKAKCPEMDIQVSRCESMPFETGAFDIITVCLAYHHFADKDGFAREAARILKPGGALHIADPRLPFIVRKLLNGFFRHINVAGEINTSQEIFDHLGKYGFTPGGFACKGYAQVMKLTRSQEEDG